MAHVFSTVNKVVTGVGCFDSLPVHAAGLGKKCLLVSGKGAMVKQGFIEKAETMLNSAGISTCVLLGIGHDPDITDIETGRKLFNEKECDMVLGIGGGSAIDAAKAIAKFASTDKPVKDFFDGAELPLEGFPVIACPSTFGTGTEATRVSVLSDRSQKLKKGLRHESMLPKVAIVDPMLGMKVPPELCAHSGLDALTQAIESFISKYSSDLTEALAFNAFVLISSGLPEVMKDPDNLEARSNCANGSVMAGMAFSNSRLGVVHGLAHPLGARYGLRHGEACGICLPFALEYNRETVAQKYDLLSGFIGMDIADWVRQRLTDFGLPTDLKNFNIPQDDFAAIAQEVMPSSSTKANPREVTPEDVVDMLGKMCL